MGILTLYTLHTDCGQALAKNIMIPELSIRWLDFAATVAAAALFVRLPPVAFGAKGKVIDATPTSVRVPTFAAGTLPHRNQAVFRPSPNIRTGPRPR